MRAREGPGWSNLAELEKIGGKPHAPGAKQTVREFEQLGPFVNMQHGEPRHYSIVDVRVQVWPDLAKTCTPQRETEIRTTPGDNGTKPDTVNII